MVCLAEDSEDMRNNNDPGHLNTGAAELAGHSKPSGQKRASGHSTLPPESQTNRDTTETARNSSVRGMQQV